MTMRTVAQLRRSRAIGLATILAIATPTLAAAGLVGSGCAKKKSPTEEVGDAFVEHYLKADQEGALPFTALGANSQLQRELKDAREARGDGVSPDVDASYERVGEDTRDRRTVLLYQIASSGKDAPKRSLRVELADLGQGPKVVLYELH